MRTLFDLLRRNWLFFLLATAAALALRLFFVFHFPHVEGDTFVYGDIAKNWLNHGIFGLTDNGTVRPTLIRLPGYPGFLAAMFALFGQEHYRAVMIAQALVDANTCLVIAAIALELMGARAAKAAYLLAALCPFTAMYAATPLSETLSICCVAHALYYCVRGLKALGDGHPALPLWLLCGIWTSAAIFMRPDNGLLLPAMGWALLALLLRSPRKRQVVLAGVALALAGLAPLVPWAVRNWHVFHVWQPLASRYASDPGEFLPRGFNHWMRTWIVDFVSVEEVYWKVSGEPVDPRSLPERAFDARPQYDKTLELLARYNQQLYLDPEIDAEFEQIASERENHHLMRYAIWLPGLRMTDMWLRPRTEMLNVETRWWEFSAHKNETVFALAWAGLNVFFLAAALAGLRRWPLGAAGWTLLGFVIIRSLFLSTLENPEPRYVLECFPAVLAWAGGAFARK
jgi:4-amino-4-deoxy-L-arabinose transferase-like glycosyltransferase